MEVYISERLLIPGENLRVLALKRESSLPDRSPAQLVGDIQIVHDEEAGAERAVQELAFQLGPVSELQEQKGYPDFYASEIAKITPGSFVVSVRMREQRHNRSLIALSQQSYSDFKENILQERFIVSEKFTDSTDFSTAWLESWNAVHSYLGNPTPSQIKYNVRLQEINPNDIGVMPPSAFRWVAFHIGRFAFKQVFYGGTVDVTAGGRDKITITLTPRIQSFEKLYIEPLQELFRPALGEFGVSLGTVGVRQVTLSW